MRRMEHGDENARSGVRGTTHDRRAFLARLVSIGGALAVARPLELAALGARWNDAASPGPASPKHPDPRPGIDASRVLPAGDVPAELTELFDHVREIPQVVDGIRCQCGCAELDGMYSLLSCYEESGMALHCHICQGEAALAYRLHGEGRTLDEIRVAIDRRTW